MPIFNQTKNTVIAKSFKLCKNPLVKALGLMFRKPSPLVFPFINDKKVCLHSCFVLGPIDLVFLDSKGFVVELKSGWRPFSFYKNKRKAATLLELPKGAIKTSRTTLNDKIVITG